MIEEARVISRFLSATTSFALILMSLKGVMFYYHLEKSSINDTINVFSYVFFLLAAILLFLDFLDVKIGLINKRMWMPLFLLGFGIYCYF